MKNFAYVIVAPDFESVAPDLIRGPVFFLTLHQQQNGFRIKSGMTGDTDELF